MGFRFMAFLGLRLPFLYDSGRVHRIAIIRLDMVSQASPGCPFFISQLIQDIREKISVSRHYVIAVYLQSLASWREVA
jgi:hypothetical protein